MLRFVIASAIAFAGFASATAVRADHAPTFVVPSRPGVPIVINGRNVAWAVVEGDWGLFRPGHMPVTIIGGSPLMPDRMYRRRGTYYPAYGSQPERGRHEIEPPPDRMLPEPAESFSRNWSSHSEPQRELRPGEHMPRNRYNPNADVVPPTIADPNAFYPPILVVPRRP